MSRQEETEYRAWVWAGRGEPSILRKQHKVMPVPGSGEVVVANRAIALNPVDWKMIEAGHGDWHAGHVPGVDGAGSITAVGDGVRLPVGTRVAYHQSLSRDGSFAEFTCLRAEGLLLLPEGVSDDVAASIPCPGITAWQAIRKVPATRDRDVLVVGAGGAVGLLLAQLAVERGWRVWVTAAPDHHAQLLSLGVIGAFDYRDEDWRDRLQTALGDRRLFAAFDTVSGEHARSLASLIGYNGHLVCIQDRVETAPLPAFSTAISLHEVALNSIHRFAGAHDWREWREAGERLFAMVRLGHLELPPIHNFQFEELPKALSDLKARKVSGKFVALV